VIQNSNGRRSYRAALFVARISLAALAVGAPVRAWAECSPSPNPQLTDITCTGTTTNGVTLTAYYAPLTVVSDATVTNTGASAITVAIPSPNGYYSRNAVITVNGIVTAYGAPGITVSSGTTLVSTYDFSGTYASISVAPTGIVSGTTGIALTQSPGPYSIYSPTRVMVYNEGTISGTSGVAISTSGNYARLDSIINTGTGTIGAIAARFGQIHNSGTIEGGSLSAISQGNVDSNYLISNNSIIHSASNAATISIASAQSASLSNTIINSHVIANDGAGGAIYSGNYLTIENDAGATIASKGAATIANGSSLALNNLGLITNTGGGMGIIGSNVSINNYFLGTINALPGADAISVSGKLTLLNTGTINGNIVTTLGMDGAMLDSSAGTINGNVLLGPADDTVVANYVNGALVTGINGTLDGGGGTNLLQINFLKNAELSNALTLPTNFFVMNANVASGATVTLGQGFTAYNGLGINGAGSLVNKTTLFGTIQIGAQGSSLASFVNDGTIIANGTGVYDQNGKSLSNTGAILSLGGTGLVLTETNGTPNTNNTNSGAITGSTVGASLFASSLVNTGTISGATGVLLDMNSFIDNREGGLIMGSTAAISSLSTSALVSVANAGTINGNVNLLSPAPSYYGSYNKYWAKMGGMLYGNLTLGSGDALITTISGSGTSGYAGINGTVSASNSVLRYDVTGNESATLAMRSGFTSLGYQVAGGAALTLNTNGAFGSTVNLAGQGNVVLNGTIAATNAVAIQEAAVMQPGMTTLPTALTITNNGALSMTLQNSPYWPGYGSVFLQSSNVINNGKISFTDLNNSATIIAAVYTGGGVTNNGTITSNVGYGVRASTLTNNGTITAGNSAVVIGTNTVNTTASITNSGTLTSTASAAITNDSSYSPYYTLTNLAGGTITGFGDAIRTAGGTIINSGTINGNVNLNYWASSFYNMPGFYVAKGGTINGNLNFGNADDYLVETGSGFGVTGTINGGAGVNWIGHQRSGTATVSLGGALLPGFTNEFTLASGASSQVTITGPSGYTDTIYVGGDGAIINQLATTGMVSSFNFSAPTFPRALDGFLGSFSNRADVGRLFLLTSAFDNSATIGTVYRAESNLTLFTNNGFSFSNSGTILNSGGASSVFLRGTTVGNSIIANSGTIIGGIDLSMTGAAGSTLAINNSGTINGYVRYSNGFDPVTNAFIQVITNNAMLISLLDQQRFSLANSGTITGDIILNGGDMSVVNTGMIRGSLATGAGNDAIAMNGAFSGSINGGAGINTLSVNGGSQAAPVAFASVSNIASMTQTGGFATVSGIGSFGSVMMTGGRLVGLAGSVMNADSFTVGGNATFGSAGAVNGNVVVNGTLSPGASPGTMTVNGNVTLNGGSTSLFEITPTVSDKLIVNGRLTILPGSTLQIAASAPVKVGTTLNLISASGGVTGTYDTVTGITGAVRKLANGDMGLLVQFANPVNYTPQVRNAIAYVNNAMAANSAPAALFPALSALQDGNAAPIASAFAQLTPEPYADAMQIGAETALSQAAASRSMGEGEVNGTPHLFGFGQMLGSLRQFSGNQAQGVSSATTNGFGVLGGLGVAGGNYAASVYMGWMDQDQSVAMLGASTKARGVIGGVAARFGEITRLTLSANYDRALAKTRRYVPGAGTIMSSYLLPSWSFDASISHAVPLGGGWVVRPQIGTTWVITKRGAIDEVSPHPFALSVNAARMVQGFVDAGLSFETAPDAAGPWRRFLTLGARYRAEGGQADTTAGLAGYTPGLTALGVGRNRLDVTMAAGVEYRLTPGASFFLNATGELGVAGKRESVTGGVRFRL